MKLFRPGSVCAVALTAAASLAACSGSAKTAHAGGHVVAGGSVTIGLNADPGNLDPQRSVNGPNLLMSVFGYDTPVTLLNNGQLAPQVLTSWTPGDKSYTLHVRSGVTCADSTAMDAQTVADNINYVGDSKSESPMAGVAVPSGAHATADASANTVTVSLPAASPFFMQNLAELPLVCRKGLTDRASLARSTAGSGPYVLSSVAPGDHYDYTLRKGYKWGPNGAGTDANGSAQKITFKVVTSKSTTANLLLNGQLNIAQLSGPDTKRLKSGGLFSAGAQFIGNELVFDESAGEAVADVAVRRALVGALNLPDLATIDTGGLGGPANGLIADPKICAGDTMKGNTPAYDLAGSRSALDAAGWIAGAGGVRSKDGKRLSVSIIYANEPTNSATAQYIAAQWKKLGVDLKLNEQSFDQTSAVVFGKGEWGATLIGLGVSTPQTLVPFFSGPSPTAGNNFGHLDNPGYTSAVARAVTKDGTAGCADWNAAESALFKDADITPISNTAYVYWGNKAKFDVIAHILIPTSIRILG